MAQGLKRVDEAGLTKERSRSPNCEVDGDLFGGREKTLFVDVSSVYTIIISDVQFSNSMYANEINVMRLD